MFYPHSYQSIPLLSWTPGNNSVLLKYATTHVTEDQGTVYELKPRLFPIFVVNSLLLWSNSALLWVTLFLLCTFLTLLLWLQTQLQLPHALLCHKVPLYPQCYEDARKLLKRSSLYLKITFVQNLCPAHHPIQNSALVL